MIAAVHTSVKNSATLLFSQRIVSSRARSGATCCIIYSMQLLDHGSMHGAAQLVN